MLPGRMMQFPLTIGHLLERARTQFPRSQVVSRRPDKSLIFTAYSEICARALRLGGALERAGVKEGDRVATLCWNHREHLEAYLGIPAMGAIVHTLNLRLHPSELSYIAHHAEDVAIIVDQSLLPLFEKFRAAVPSIKHVIVVADLGKPVEGAHEYEQFIAGEPAPLRDIDENAAAMLCYTSGTTGNPKGVLYSHRSTVLHALTGLARDALGVGASDVVMPVVPMFHAAAWGLPYIAVLCGAELVFPGPHLDAASLVSLMKERRATVAGGVPTIWLGILQLLDANPAANALPDMRTMVIGGSAAPPSLIAGFDKHGLEVMHAWGMTETNPLGTMARVKPHLKNDSITIRATQGYAVPFVETRHTDDDGRVLPWDAKSVGELEVRGPWVASSYFGDEDPDRFTKDGWFKTGDVVTICPNGYVRITDRTKDVIKSGGEWISSVALENALMAHPSVLEAAVFAARHEKWAERPIAAIVLKPEKQASEADLRAHLEGKFPKFHMPDAFLFLAEIPRTSTGKFAKRKLREQHGEMLMPKA